MKNFDSSYIPIDAPLGNDARVCIVLTLLALSPFLLRGKGKGKKECLLLCGGILLLALNPWCAQAIADRTNAVMSWRWIWIAPIPVATALLLAIFWGRLRQSALPVGWGVAVARSVLTLLFLCAGLPTCRSGNGDFHFSWPQWKVPREYAEVVELVDLLPADGHGVTVLAPARQSAWLPVASPGIGVVALGHTQFGALGNLVPEPEHTQRGVLQVLVERRPHKLMEDHIVRFMRGLGITHMIAPNITNNAEVSLALKQSNYLKLTGNSDNFFVLSLCNQ